MEVRVSYKTLFLISSTVALVGCILTISLSVAVGILSSESSKTDTTSQQCPLYTCTDGNPLFKNDNCVESTFPPRYVQDECRDVVFANYNSGTKNTGMMKPYVFDQTQVHNEPFNNISFKEINMSENISGRVVTVSGIKWGFENVPRNVKCGIFIHGGSWYSGSPLTESYAPFVAKISNDLGIPVLSVTYPLIGETKSVYKSLIDITNASLLMLSGQCNDGFIVMGDSSGGGSAMAGVLTLANSYMLHGVILVSPWLNLYCDSPTYSSNTYLTQVIDPSCVESKILKSGDICFTDLPNTSTSKFKENARAYLGPDNSSLIHDQFANPYLANRTVLSVLNKTRVLIAIGGDELLLSESLIFGQKLTSAGVQTSVHVYDQMWHDFPMYLYGCGDATYDSGQRLLFAERFFDMLPFFDNLIPGVFYHFEENGNDTLLNTDIWTP